MNPLWNNLLIGGFKDGEAFLGTVDMIGTAFTDEFLATGFGAHLALPILRKRWHEDMEEVSATSSLPPTPLLNTHKYFPTHTTHTLTHSRSHSQTHSTLTDQGEARELLEDCLRVLFYRDCRALNKIQVAKATAEGTIVSEPYTIETNWSSASFMATAGQLQGDGGW